MLNPRPLIAKLLNHWKHDRGAAIVEAAIAIPILLLVIMGSIEFGFAWEAKSANTSGVRTGVLRAASIGDKPETDMRIIQSVIGEVGADRIANIEWIIIFDASANVDDQTTIDDCAAAIAGGGIVDQCVVYSPATLQAVLATADPDLYQATNFDNGGGVGDDGLGNETYDCQALKLDTNWCAPKRTLGGDAEVGVAVQYSHEWFTGIFPAGNAPTFQDSAVSSTFLENGSDITPAAGGYTPTGTTYSGSGTDFSSGVLNDEPNVTWTNADDSDIETAPNGVTFLGPFTNETVTMTVEDLDQPHTQICISFTLYAIDSWDGGSVPTGDVFGFGVDGSTTPASEETYYSTNFDSAPLGDYGRTYTSSAWWWGDTQFNLSKCFDHTGDTADFDFYAYGLQGINDESWGIDDIVVTVS